MSLQQVRGAMAKITSDALTAAGIPFNYQYFDNVQETPAGAETAYAVIFISFPRITIDTIGCDGAEAIQGTCNVNMYMPKRMGMKPGEDVAIAVLTEWNRLNKNDVADRSNIRLHTTNKNGPNALAPNNLPHQIVNLSCSFTAHSTAGALPPAPPSLPPGSAGATGAVGSVFARKGDVVAEEGDYLIDQLGDVDTTTDPPAPEEMMKWDGTNWVPSESVDSGTFP